MFNRFSATSSLSTPAAAGSTASFFGQPQQQPNSQQLGTNTSIPAQSPSPFNNPFGGAGAPVNSMAAPVTPYAITNELENGITVKLLSISAMPAYRHLSQEEVRVDDYSKGRKGPSSFPGSNPSAFSQSFSSAPTPTSTNGFPFSSTPSSGFGGFGGTSTPAAPTATAPTTGFSGFGSSNTANPNATPSSSFGGFGGGSGAFGSTGTGAFANTPLRNGFSGFGSSTTAPAASTGGFNAYGASNTGASGFTGTGGFGSTTSASSPFGSSTSTANPPAGTTSNTFGGFGQPQSQQAPATQPFGSTSGGMFGAKPSTGMFGTPSTGASTTPAAPSFGTSAFGTPFGQTSQIQPTSTGFPGGFGTQPQQPQTQQSTGFGSGMFGSSAPTTSSAGMFGTTAPSSSSAFGSAATPFGSASTGMFGQQPAQSTQQSTGMFGTAPSGSTSTATNNLFRPTGSSFGGGLSTIPSSTTPLASNSTGMFSNLSGGLAPGSTGISGMFNRPTTATGSTPTTGFSFQPSSTFTLSTLNTTGFNTQLQQPTSIYQPSSSAALPLVQPAPAGSLSLFPPLPQIFTKPAESQQPATSSAAPKSPVKFTPRTSFRIKPREAYNLTTPIPINFGTGLISNNSAAASTNLVPRKMMAGSIPNIKKLVIPDFNEISETPSTPSTSSHPYHTASVPSYTPTSATSAASNILTDSMSFGQQYTFPPLKTLKTMDRREIKNFVIGQKGVGEVRFLVPVDLSEIDPELLFGHYIEFCEGEAVLYPDPSIPKPEPGCGLNLPAQVRLERIWTMSKGSRDPIVDPQSEKVVHFIQKLKEAEGTNFISYDPSTGAWTFTVDNF